MKSWKPSRPVLIGLVLLHVVVTAVTLRDLSRRSQTDIRGARRFWQFLVPLQMGNSALYWVVGRKRNGGA